MRAAVFSHYDVHGIVDDYVIYSLRCYRQYFDRIIFVSTTKLDINQQNKVRLFVDAVICRENIGYDFLSWRCGFEDLFIASLDSVTFINDSVYGPCKNIQDMMKISEESKSDLWGVSINRQVKPHVQSYFMTFKSNLLRSGFAKRFWEKVEPVDNKLNLILRYEVGLSALVHHNGFKIDAIVDLTYLNKSVRETVLLENAPFDKDTNWDHIRNIILHDPSPNPVQLFWGEMLRMGAPFVKIELFKGNPMGVNVASVYRHLMRDNWYNKSLIFNHLERVLPQKDFVSLLDLCDLLQNRKNFLISTAS